MLQGKAHLTSIGNLYVPSLAYCFSSEQLNSVLQDPSSTSYSRAKFIQAFGQQPISWELNSLYACIYTAYKLGV